MEGRQDFTTEKTLYDENLLKVELLGVANHDGSTETTVRTMGPECESVATIVLNDEQQVLLLWRNQPTWDVWGWEVPRSPIRPREIFSKIARESVRSRTGWEPEKPKSLFSLHGEGYAPSMTHVFLALDARYQEGKRDVNYSGDVAWIPLSQIHDLLNNNEITESVTQAALLRFLSTQGQEPAQSGETTYVAPREVTNPNE